MPRAGLVEISGYMEAAFMDMFCGKPLPLCHFSRNSHFLTNDRGRPKMENWLDDQVKFYYFPPL